MDSPDIDRQLRLAAFRFLEEQMLRRGEVLPRQVLADGFRFEGQRVPLLGPQGIFKPAVLPDTPLSITTVPVVSGRPRPYEDELGPDGLLRYRYRGTDPKHHDNVGLRRAMQRQTPLIYFHGIVPGEYLPVWPVFVQGDDPAALTFRVAIDERRLARVERLEEQAEETQIRRIYVTRTTIQRAHQESFRKRVLRAYRETCAICRLRHEELLEAAHIIPDSDPRGAPVVPNGIALCKLHHAAFDRFIVGVRPDHVVEIRADILAEGDGPMLRHGLQGFHGAQLVLPRRRADRPKPEFLEERYERFRKAG